MDGLAFGIKDSVEEVVDRVRSQLAALQKRDGHFV